jgi:hypothetical protein
VAPERARGGGRSGEEDEVLAAQLGQHATRTTGHQLKGAVGEHPAVDDAADDRFGEVSGGTGRLHDRGDAGEEGGSELLEEAPHRKVEGIDLDLHAAQRGVDVPGDEGVLLAQLLDLAVD